MKAKKKKPKHRPITGRDPTSQLYRAIVRYVESKNGSLVVIGGVQIQEWPDDRPGIFVVGVRCLGRKPVVEEKK